MYKIRRLLWSIYFVLSIGVIGLLFGYVLTLSLYLIAFAFSFWPAASEKIRHFAEAVQCLSIRMLLRLQPWLKCETNLHPIVGFYDKLGTRKVLFVANHRSNLDTFLLISYIPGLRGLAKSTLFYNVFFAPYMWAAGFVPVHKGSAQSFVDGVRHLGDRLLMKNRAVLIFPENTRCDKGFLSVQKFSSAVFMLAIQTKSLIVPLVMKNTDGLMGRGDLLIHPGAPVQITMLEPVDAGRYSDEKELRQLVWNQIAAGVS